MKEGKKQGQGAYLSHIFFACENKFMIDEVIRLMLEQG